MTIKREALISLDATPYYHCYVRCVRQAYLCGDNVATGENYDHRKQWIVSRIRFLSYVYAIDICAYAVMSNHYHLVLHVDQAKAKSWTDEEVVGRWMQLYKGHLLVDSWLEDAESLDQLSLTKVKDIIAEWRERLANISWFMRGVNEKVARMANKEEGHTGRFWESRFKSQALLDDAAVLSCMAYVDLNPIRAGLAGDLCESDYTSIQQRLFDHSVDVVTSGGNDTSPISESNRDVLSSRLVEQAELKEELGVSLQPEAELVSFSNSSNFNNLKKQHVCLPFSLDDYLEVVEYTGRAIVGANKGYINERTPKVLSRLGLQANTWVDHVTNCTRSYASCVGSVDNILNFAERFDRRWGKGVSKAAKSYCSA
ncbi:MAG: REP element-mobilizing transposase RayT [Flavobacteriales bacterium]|jgi:REP element-mobilizing transposase RayT